MFTTSAEGVSVNLCVWALALFHPWGMLIVATDWEESHHFFLWRLRIVELLGSAVLPAGSKMLPYSLSTFYLLFFPVHSILLCLVPGILVAARLIICINGKCNTMLRDLISSLGSWAKPPPVKHFYLWGLEQLPWVLGWVYSSWSQPYGGRTPGQVPGTVS